MRNRENDIDSTRPEESLTVSVGRALRDQAVQEQERCFKSQAKS